jgi:hypothetical protein
MRKRQSGVAPETKPAEAAIVLTASGKTRHGVRVAIECSPEFILVPLDN